MAKEIAIGKRAKISEAQQYMLLSVLGASVFLGIALSLVTHFIDQISFNTKVIMAEEAAIVSYSNVIRDTGVCKKPKGTIYSNSELEKCEPESIEVSEIPGTLRANILEDVASNAALNSVPNESNSTCLNPSTRKAFTYEDLRKIYDDARSAADRQAASQLIKSCSALRIIPDALPAYRNEEALLASLNKLFIISDWEPETLSPSGSSSSSKLAPGLNAISLNFRVESNSDTTLRVINNIERSIREFDFERATIEWHTDNTLQFAIQSTAYFMDKSTIKETTQTITPENKK